MDLETINVFGQYKKEQECMGNLIDLSKKAKIVLEKKNLGGIQAEIVFAIDRSGSMDDEYRDGTVQELIGRLLAIGMNMDINKQIEVFQFDTTSRYVGTASADNHTNFVKNNRMTANGGTKYAPVMKAIIDKNGTPLSTGSTSSESKKGLLGGLFGKKSIESAPAAIQEIKPQQHPTFVFFITDGTNSDTGEAERVIRESSNQPIFWQFVGIGRESFDFLQKLDDLKGRYVDNADFFKIQDIKKISDEELYEKLLTEFPDWLKEVKSKGMLL